MPQMVFIVTTIRLVSPSWNHVSLLTERSTKPEINVASLRCGHYWRRKEVDVRSARLLLLPYIRSVSAVACAIPIIKAGLEVHYKLIHRVGEEI